MNLFRINILEKQFYVSVFSNLFCMTRFFQVKVKAKELRGKKKDELLKQLDELKTVSFEGFILIFQVFKIVI